MAVFTKELRDAVLELCTIKDIYGLLEAARDHPSVRLTAPNIATLVDKNLADALEGNAVSLTDVYDLVREAEENGHQEIFYYQSRSKAVENIPLEEVGRRIWGDNWADVAQFPRFELEPNGFRYADLRHWNPKRKPRDWVLKIYGQQFFEKQEEGSEEQLAEHRVRRTFVLEPRRLVLLLRWNSPDLLEVRIPQTASRPRAKAWLDQAWDMASRVFLPSEFEAWDLDSARRQLVNRQGDSETLYRFSHSRLEDGDHNVISVASAHTERSLTSSAPIVQSIKALVTPGVGECKYLRVTWLPGEGEGAPRQDLVTFLGDRQTNCVGIGRRCAAHEIDYVTDQLREFSKAASGV